MNNTDSKRSVDKPSGTILPENYKKAPIRVVTPCETPKPSGITINAMEVFMKDKDHTIGSLEAFLHDVWEGESEFEEVLNIMGYNELKYVVDRAKLFEATIKSYTTVVNGMVKDAEEIKSLLIDANKAYTENEDFKVNLNINKALVVLEEIDSE